jgi:drug/metabolite transporter superfamily protein YnfA
LRILLGKTKGVFVIDEGRVQGPFCDGWPINHVAADPKSGRIYAAGGGVFHGAEIWHSDDGAH